MNFFKKLFSGKPKQESPGDVLAIANKLSPLIENISIQVFTAYREKLLSESITYIVPAVWGATKEGELDDIQKVIHEKISPVVEEIFAALELRGLASDQRFAIHFIIRGYIISKITYLIEAFRGMNLARVNATQEDSDMLERVKPWGNA